MSSKKSKSKSKFNLDITLFPAVLAGASILGLGILASKRFIENPQEIKNENVIKPIALLEYNNPQEGNKIVDKICDDYLSENEKLELNYYKELLPNQVISEINDLILNSGASFLNLNDYCNKKYNLGTMELTNCINYSKIKSDDCVRKKRDV